MIQKKCKQKHKERVTKELRSHWLRFNYGIDVEYYNQLLSKQNGKCAICGKTPDKINLSVDHDHKTGKIRGLLCKDCNFGIAHFKDNIILLGGAIDYLKKTK